MVTSNLLHGHWIISLFYSIVSAFASAYSIYAGMSERIPIKYIKSSLKVAKNHNLHFIVIHLFPITEFTLAEILIASVTLVGILLILIPSFSKKSKKHNCNFSCNG